MAGSVLGGFLGGAPGVLIGSTLCFLKGAIENWGNDCNIPALISELNESLQKKKPAEWRWHTFGPLIKEDQARKPSKKTLHKHLDALTVPCPQYLEMFLCHEGTEAKVDKVKVLFEESHARKRFINKIEGDALATSAPSNVLVILPKIIDISLRIHFDKEFTLEAIVAEQSAIQAVDVQRLGELTKSYSPSSAYGGAEGYNNLAARLYKDFKAFIEGQEVAEENLFEALRSGLEKVPPLQEGMVNLLLPKKVLAHIKKEIHAKARALCIACPATLVPAYEFSDPDSEGRRTFAVLMTSGKGEDTVVHGRRPLFRVDELCLQALSGSPLEGDGELSRDSRMLIHLFYCGLAGLGMPGSGTFSLSTGKAVVSRDRLFEGFLLLLDKRPESFFDFRASVYDASASKALSKGVYPADMNHQWERKAEINFTNEGMALQMEALEQLAKFDQKQLSSKAMEAYRKFYFLAAALCRAGIALPRGSDGSKSLDVVTEIMEETGLPHPDKLKASILLDAPTPDIGSLLARLDALPPSTSARRLLTLRLDLFDLLRNA